MWAKQTRSCPSVDTGRACFWPCSVETRLNSTASHILFLLCLCALFVRLVSRHGPSSADAISPDECCLVLKMEFCRLHYLDLTSDQTSKDSYHVQYTYPLLVSRMSNTDPL